MATARLLDIAPAEWARLRQLLDEALALPADARAAWLAALPAQDAPLRPRLEGLLAHADDSLAPEATGAAGRRFGSLPRLAPADNTPPPLPPDAGPYRAVRLLGEGGMGRVWLAERTDLLHGRPVALKLPHAYSPHPRLAERMAQEREILAVLDHPNIARIYDAGVTADGQPWLALEYVQGERIDTYANAHGLGVRQRIGLFLQVMAAVAHAHARLVVHRDLKPGNVLVTPAGEVRLLDFGIAKLLAPGAAAPELTAPAQRALTPQYAAPEQILGRPIGTAADIYALGVVLYELLTGERPYRPRRDTPAALEETILGDTPPRPSQRCADAATRRVLAGDLDTVLLKALKKDPAERYATVQAFADDLGRWLARRPVSAQPDSAWYHARRFIQRNAVPVSLAAGFVVSLGAALGVALWQAGEARAQAAKAGAITDFLVGLFRANDIEQADGRAKREQSVQQLLEHSADALETGLTDQPVLRDELQRVVGGLLNDLEIPEAAIRVRRARLAGLQAAGAPVAQQLAAMRELGKSLRDHSEWSAARETLGQAEALCAVPPPASDAACLGVQLDLGRVDFAQRKVDAALRRAEPLTAALAALMPASASDLADAHELLALLRMLRNEPDAADAAFGVALRLRQAEWGEGSVRLAQMRYRFGRHLWTARRLTQAEAEMQAAWHATQAALGAEHVASARNELYLGRLQALVGLKPEGIGHLRHAHEALVAQAARLDPSELYEAEATWANALTLEGRLAEARAALDDAAVRRRDLGARAGPDSTLDVAEARWLLDTGRFAEARSLLGRLRDSTAAQLGAHHPVVGDRWMRLAAVALAEGDLAAAGQAVQSALATDDNAESVFGSVKHRARLLQVLLWLEQGRLDEAVALADQLHALAQGTPRAEIYSEALVLLHEATGRAAAATGSGEGALAAFGRAIDLLSASGPPEHPRLAGLLARRGAVRLRQGDGAGARDDADRARAVLAAQPLAGAQYRRPLHALDTQLAASRPG